MFCVCMQLWGGENIVGATFVLGELVFVVVEFAWIAVLVRIWSVVN